jgi:probable HAF family extracellular repeat protein
MKSRTLLSVAAVLFAVLAFAGRSAAQGNQDHTHQHHHYSLIDMGTFGGPQSYNYGEDAQSLNNRGTVVGQADTPIPDPNYPNVNPLVDLFPDPFIQHSFKWQRGIRTDLGALPAVNSSVVSWVNDKGAAVGISTTGSIDPITGWPAAVAVAWNNGQITNLGTLGGNESLATAINDRGEIVGVSANTTLDLNSLFGLGTQTRAFLWQGGVMRDIGTLGGTDAAPLLINNRGQVAGFSYTSSLALDPFLWDNGSMIA